MANNKRTQKAKNKGWWGEFKIKAALFLFLGDGYKVYNNLYLPMEDGGITQVDHFVLSKYGIFVIETKNYSGLIHVFPQEQRWVQVLNNRQNGFYSPLRQNYAHIMALRHILDVPQTRMFNIVAFTGRARFADKRYLPKKSERKQVVGSIFGLIRYIKSKKKVLLDKNQIPRYKKLIRRKSLRNTRGIERRHLRQVSRKKYGKRR